jgi:ferritin-like metal-binding protein YciE
MMEDQMEKQSAIVTQYLSDMHVLEKHIQEALEKQVAQTKDQPDVNAGIQRYLATTKTHVERLQQRMEQLGNQDGIVDKAKEAVTNRFGQAAGAIDAVRTHQTSKNLRDDYTAASLASISYVMLQTTALACNDEQSAKLAEKHLGETVEMLQWIARTMPEIVVRDLQEERDAVLNAGAAARVTAAPALSGFYGSKTSI